MYVDIVNSFKEWKYNMKLFMFMIKRKILNVVCKIVFLLNIMIFI